MQSLVTKECATLLLRGLGERLAVGTAERQGYMGHSWDYVYCHNHLDIHGMSAIRSLLESACHNRYVHDYPTLRRQLKETYR